MTLSKRGMALGDEEVNLLMMLDKNSKKRKNNASSGCSGVTKDEVKAGDCDLTSEEEKLSFTGTTEKRDKARIEAEESRGNEDCKITKKKESGSGKQPGKSNKDSCEDAVKNAVKKKNKLKNERERTDASLLDSETVVSGTRETKVVEMLSEGSSGNVGDEVKRKRRKRERGKKEDRLVDIADDAIQGDVSAIEHMRTHDALLDAKIVASETWESKAVEILSEGSGRNVRDELKRKRRKREREKKEDRLVDIADGAIQGDVSAIKHMRTHDALLGAITVATETQESKAVEMLSEGSAGNVRDELKRKRRKREQRKKGDGLDVADGAIQGDVSAIEDSKTHDANIIKRKKTKLRNNSKDGKRKRVRFSADVQVFPPSNDPTNEKHNEIEEDKLLFGKRFTQEEDEIVKDAVYRYIEAYDLGEEGLQKVLDSKSYTELKCCWKKIGRAIPYRPYRAVYYRAQRLFRMGERRKWTEEEYEKVRKFHGEHVPKWKVLADELGKHMVHVGNTWQRIKLANRKKGYWDQEETQTLFDLVNADLQMKLCEEKKSKHGMLRDNIPWSAISDKLSTRIAQHCCNKWYRQLTSPMVASGEWADTDDYRLIDALYELDASCIEEVDWDNLLDHRPGELCRKRWNQMVRNISRHENKSFAEQVEVLAKRYRPDLIGAREVWDRKPLVP